MTIVTDKRDRPLHATIAILLAILTGGYLAPWAVAATRGKSNVWTVFWVNLLMRLDRHRLGHRPVHVADEPPHGPRLGCAPLT